MQTFQKFLLVAPVLLFSVIAHEIAHGLAALRQGDRTALDAGRLSWNPVRHIDLFLTILLPIITFTGSSITGGQPMMFGGAKPVPVNPGNYRHPKRGDIIVSLAGVATNALIAICCVGLIAALGALGSAVPALNQTLGLLQVMCLVGVGLNAVLIAFNLLPIPPLDGSHVFKYLLPRRLAESYVRFGRFGLLALIILLQWGGGALRVWMSPMDAAARAGIDLVSPLLLPTTDQWLR
ncbi:MAG: peptidase [Gemmatimonadetes bacterium]|nr:peptidase [Gemmatimonadota bacterium]